MNRIEATINGEFEVPRDNQSRTECNACGKAGNGIRSGPKFWRSDYCEHAQKSDRLNSHGINSEDFLKLNTLGLPFICFKVFIS